MTTRTTYNTQNAKDEVWIKSLTIEGKGDNLVKKSRHSKK